MTTIKFPQLALNANVRQYRVLVNIGNKVFAALTGNLNFTTPTPSLLSIQTAVTDVEDAMVVYGNTGNRGGHAAYVDLMVKTRTLHDMLKALLQYCETTASIAAASDYTAMLAILNTTGFDIAKDKTPVGPLQAVENLRIFITRELSFNQAKLKWKRPLNTHTAKDVDLYLVYSAATNDFSAAHIVSAVATSEFIITNSSTATVTNYYWIRPVGAAGEGAISSAIAVTVNSLTV